MTIEKLKSGSYRIRQMYQGKLYLVTLPYKPSKREAIDLMAEKLKESDALINGSFGAAAREYVEIKKNVLSVRTVREYLLYIHQLPTWFTIINMGKLNQADIQRCVNELTVNHAPKTVRNYHGFISAVLSVYKPNLKVSTTLPQRVLNEPYIPSEKEVKQILEYTRDNNPFFYVALNLATMGLRRSEICALTLSDLDSDNMLHINKALVENVDKEWVIKSTKTEKSSRVIPVPQELADIIRDQGYIYKGYPNSISDYLMSVQAKLGIPKFSMHKLRHFFCSKLLSQNVPMKDIMYLGGWSTDSTIKQVYGHAMKTKTDEGKKSIMSSFWNF